MVQHVGMLCPGCGRNLWVRADFGGKRVDCRYCGHAFEMPDLPEDLTREADPFDIPGYQGLGLICNGSMGRVYKARQVSVDRVVAVKVLHRRLAQELEYVQRLRREAALGARLSHSNVAQVHDAGEVDGRPYLVMEYAHGETVLDRIAERGPFEETEAIGVTLAVAEALDHAHHRGLVHRDVKPGNVILTVDGGVKLIDFGLARPVADEDWAAAEAGSAIGTPHYISPEQTRGQADVDIRSDIYSLGATLYHMITGRVPYEGNARDILRRHADPRDRPEPPAQLNPAVSPGLAGVLGAMMAKNRQARYRRAGDLIDDLRRLLRSEPPVLSGSSDEIPALSADQWATLLAGPAPPAPSNGTTAAPEPVDPAALIARARERCAEGQYAEAADDYTAALQAEPGRADLLRDRGDAFWHLKSFDRALADYTEALRLDPEDAGSYARRGGLFLRLGDYARAFDDLAAAVRLAPDVPAARNRLAWLQATCPLADLRDGPAAVASATRACELTGWTVPGVLDTLAAAFAESGDFASALKWQARAVRALPESSPDRGPLVARLVLYRIGMPYRESRP
jgi:serine/threonine-protein kinase